MPALVLQSAEEAPVILQLCGIAYASLKKKKKHLLQLLSHVLNYIRCKITELHYFNHVLFIIFIILFIKSEVGPCDLTYRQDRQYSLKRRKDVEDL